MKNYKNRLTPAEDERLEILEKQCSEAILAVRRIKEFGFQERQPSNHGFTNREMLEIEVGGILGVMTTMYDSRDMSPSRVNRAWDEKTRILKQVSP